jgi:HSP20 family protein
MPDIEVRKKQTQSPTRQRREWPSLFAEPAAWTPFAMMRRMADEMDRAFGGWSDMEEAFQSAWPAIDVYEEDSTLNVKADLPGMKPDDVKVEVSDGQVLLSGERKQEHEEKREGYYRSERSYGSFRRMIPLPEDADIDKAEAEFHDGELRIRVPIPENSRHRRQIPIGKK